MYYNNQPADVQERINGYELTIYLCDGDPSEKLEWFQIVNIAGERLTDQELRNAVYAGPWLADAKRYFSQSGCPARGISEGYLKGNPIRQELLQTAIRWASDGEIEDYMGRYQNEANAVDLWSHFRAVIDWAADIFPTKRPYIMPGVDWGRLHALHRDRNDLDPAALEEKIDSLIALGGKGGQSPISRLPGICALSTARTRSPPMSARSAGAQLAAMNSSSRRWKATTSRRGRTAV